MHFFLLYPGHVCLALRFFNQSSTKHPYFNFSARASQYETMSVWWAWKKNITSENERVIYNIPSSYRSPISLALFLNSRNVDFFLILNRCPWLWKRNVFKKHGWRIVGSCSWHFLLLDFHTRALIPAYISSLRVANYFRFCEAFTTSRSATITKHKTANNCKQVWGMVSLLEILLRRLMKVFTIEVLQKKNCDI